MELLDSTDNQSIFNVLNQKVAHHGQIRERFTTVLKSMLSLPVASENSVEVWDAVEKIMHQISLAKKDIDVAEGLQLSLATLNDKISLEAELDIKTKDFINVKKRLEEKIKNQQKQIDQL